jgi:hypothetical protein
MVVMALPTIRIHIGMAAAGAGGDVLIGATGMVAGAGVAVGVAGAAVGMEDGTVAGMEGGMVAVGTADAASPLDCLT